MPLPPRHPAPYCSQQETGHSNCGDPGKGTKVRAGSRALGEVRSSSPAPFTGSGVAMGLNRLRPVALQVTEASAAQVLGEEKGSVAAVKTHVLVSLSSTAVDHWAPPTASPHTHAGKGAAGSQQ